MKQYSKKLFSLVVLCSTASVMLQGDCCTTEDSNDNRVVPFIQWRSQGRDMARKLYGTTSYAVYQDDMDATYGTFNVTLQYDQTFRGKDITQALFGNSLVGSTAVNSCDDDCNSALIISGLDSGTRANTEWMAENFMLPRDFKSAITFSPKIQDVVVDFNLYVGLDRWVKGLYFRLYGPVAWNKADLHAEETLINLTPTAGYTQGYFDLDTPVASGSLFQSALNFFGGCQLPTYAGRSVTVAPLEFAKFSDCNIASANSCDNECGSSSNTKTGFAELRGEFGWNYMREKYRLLLNIQAAAPTGSRPDAEFLFPAYVGNGKHWELGVGLGGAWKMWGSEDGEKSFNFIVEADITHLFDAKQKLTLDLKGKPNSRYMLAERLGTPAADAALTTGTSTFAAPDATAGFYSPVANFSTRDVKVSFGVQGDVVAMFNYTVRGFSWDIGYNFWGLSSSSINLSDNCDDSCGVVPFPANTWALKGDASIAGYNQVAGGDLAIYGLGATESAATIFAGVNAGLNNANIDTPVLAEGAVPATDLFVFPGVIIGGTRINTSSAPIFISIDDLDLEGAEQRGLSHKVFTHFNYTWTNRDKYVPYVGAGFSAEFGSHSGNSSDCCDTTTTVVTTTADCPSSLSCALSKWAVEIKGGVSFH